MLAPKGEVSSLDCDPAFGASSITQFLCLSLQPSSAQPRKSKPAAIEMHVGKVNLNYHPSGISPIPFPTNRLQPTWVWRAVAERVVRGGEPVAGEVHTDPCVRPPSPVLRPARQPLPGHKGRLTHACPHHHETMPINPRHAKACPCALSLTVKEVRHVPLAMPELVMWIFLSSCGLRNA